MPERLVFLRDSLSLLDVPAAVELLRAHGLRPTKSVPPESRGDVVAVVVGLGRFGEPDAADFPALRTVARFGAGYDNIDADGLWRSRHVAVSYTPDVSSEEVAEFALAMMILTLRGVPRDVSGLTLQPSRWRATARGLSLSDATVGIVGCGRIGLAAARLVAPLARRLLLWNRSQRPVSLPGIAADRYEVVASLDELAARADVLSIHLALTPETTSLIGAPFFERLRAAGRSIALVNTARGDIVNEEALLAALEANIVRAAATDVWSLEGVASTADPAHNARLHTINALRHHPAVLPTSHLGAFTTGVLHRCAMQCAQNIIAVVDERAGFSGHIAVPAS
jgi:phosphoglycerate dehydrogenase-like enzyme